MVSYPFVISVCRFAPPQADLARWKGILSNFVCNPAMAGANGQNLVSREHFNSRGNAAIGHKMGF
jgi:hypothetical protein